MVLTGKAFLGLLDDARDAADFGGLGGHCHAEFLFENLLHFKKENDFVRYVTKYKKDVTNLISYINIKVTGYLTHKIYNLKSKDK